MHVVTTSGWTLEWAMRLPDKKSKAHRIEETAARGYGPRTLKLARRSKILKYTVGTNERLVPPDRRRRAESGRCRAQQDRT